MAIRPRPHQRRQNQRFLGSETRVMAIVTSFNKQNFPRGPTTKSIWLTIRRVRHFWVGNCHSSLDLQCLLTTLYSSIPYTGGITNRQKKKNSVIGLFRRESNSGSAIDSDSSSHRREREKRSASIAGALFEGGGHSSQFPVTASHRRNTRKGSLLEVSG